MSDAEDLAAQLAELTRRLEAVERVAQAPRTTVEGGTFTVVDPDGNPIFLVGEGEDGGYVAEAVNGAVLVASDLDLPGGTITETDISDDAISTPKLTANAVTADKIAAGAVVAEKIAAGSISADRLTVGVVAGELVTDGSFESADMRTARLANTAGAASAPGGQWSFASGGAYHGSWAAVVSPDGVTGKKKMYLTPELPARAGDVYTGSVALLATGSPTGGGALGVRVTKSDGSTAFLSMGTATSASAATSWTVFSDKGTIPANAVTLAVYIEASDLGAAGTWSFDAVTVRRVAQGVEIADGAITADKLDANAINGKSITGATITGGVYQTAGSGIRLEIGEGVAAPAGTAALRWRVSDSTPAGYSPYATAGFSEAQSEFVELRSGSDATGRQGMMRLGLQAYTEARGSGGVSYARLDPTAGITLGGPKLEFFPAGASQARPVLTGLVVTGTVTTNSSGVGTLTVASPGFGFTPTAVFPSQNGTTSSVAIQMFYVAGSATGTSFQIKAERNGAAFVGSVGVTALLIG